MRNNGKYRARKAWHHSPTPGEGRSAFVRNFRERQPEYFMSYHGILIGS
jgi:hypothetical protein